MMPTVSQYFEQPPRSHLYVPQAEQASGQQCSDGDASTPNDTYSVDTPMPGIERPLTKRAMSALMVTGLMYMFTIAGAYGIEESVMGGGPLLTLISIVLIPVVMGMPTALVVAELASAVPSNAGFLMWINVSFHRIVYMTMVLLSLLLTFVDNALYPVLFSEYACTTIKCNRVHTSLFRVGMIALTCVLNLVGVEAVGVASIILTIITVAPFALLFFIQLLGSGFYLNWRAISFIPSKVDWATFFTTVSWNLSGLEQAGALAEDIADPQHTLINALVPLLGLAFITYIPPILSGISVQNPDRFANVDFSAWETGFWAEVAHKVGGMPLKVLMVAGSICSAFGLTLSALCTTSRMISGMALTDAFPSVVCDLFGKRNKRFGTYHWTLIANSLLTALFSTLLDFGPLVKVDQFLYGLRVIVVYITFLHFRKVFPHLHRPFRVPLEGFWLYAVYIVSLATFAVLTVVAMTKDKMTAILCGAVFGGCVLVSCVYCFTLRRKSFPGRIVTVVEAEHTD